MLQHGGRQIANTVPPNGGVCGENEHAVECAGNVDVVTQRLVEEVVQGLIQALPVSGLAHQVGQRRAGGGEEVG